MNLKDIPVDRGDLVKARWLANKMSQLVAAKIVGVDVKLLSAVENGDALLPDDEMRRWLGEIWKAGRTISNGKGGGE